ncbi:hypothetical protein KKC88_04270 [Patescibacteria group bacterium]|nr:hypothetical protein [Patescibacteria group bacterium]MBU1964132.1 hypothetical protein [Patescibacteria group bacterium]
MEKQSKTGVIVLIVVLGVALIGGGVYFAISASDGEFLGYSFGAKKKAVPVREIDTQKPVEEVQKIQVFTVEAQPDKEINVAYMQNAIQESLPLTNANVVAVEDGYWVKITGYAAPVFIPLDPGKATEEENFKMINDIFKATADTLEKIAANGQYQTVGDVMGETFLVDPETGIQIPQQDFSNIVVNLSVDTIGFSTGMNQDELLNMITASWSMGVGIEATSGGITITFDRPWGSDVVLSITTKKDKKDEDEEEEEDDEDEIADLPQDDRIINRVNDNIQNYYTGNITEVQMMDNINNILNKEYGIGLVNVTAAPQFKGAFEPTF